MTADTRPPALRYGQEALAALLGGPDPDDPDKLAQDAATDSLVHLDLPDRELLRDACLEILGQLDGIGWEPELPPGQWVRA